MKYYFIMNPMSGSKHARERFMEDLSILGTPYELIYTTKPGDSRIYAEDICKTTAKKGERVRIFACGGDGTLHDVVNGAVGFEHVEIGTIPLGTGNDFIRNFGNRNEFLDLKNYMDSESMYCDTIQFEATYRGQKTSGHCVNMVNIGMDCNIVDTTDSIKKVPGVNGSMAYLASVFLNLVKKKGEDLRIEYEDGYVHDGKLLLISIANGCFCGGGIKGLPLATTDDGLMDVSLVKYVTRRDFLRLFPKYAKGTHLDSELLIKKDILKYTKELHLQIQSNRKDFKLCVDGEISKVQEVTFTVQPHTFRFIIPKH